MDVKFYYFRFGIFVQQTIWGLSDNDRSAIFVKSYLNEFDCYADKRKSESNF